MHHEVSFLAGLLEMMGFDVGRYDSLVMATFVVAASAIVFPLLRRQFREEDPGMVQHMLEMFVGGIRNFLTQIVGKDGERFLPMLGTFAVFILVGNFCGLIPGLQPPTGMSWGITLGLALFACTYYHLQGIYVMGFKHYLGTYLGPTPIKGLPLAMSLALNPFLIILFLVLETVTHLARIVSLATRLFGNMFGEHAASGVIFGLAPLGAPVALMMLGTLGAMMQTLIFVLLTMVYIQAVTSHH